MKTLKITGLTGLLALILLNSAISYAEDSTATTLTATEAAKPADTKIFGTLDVRPEYTTKAGMFDSSNYAQLGYQFTPDVKIGWLQGFDSNLFNPKVGIDSTGLNARWDQGYLRSRISNIYKDGDFSIGYESRVYAPTWRPEINQGNVTRFYNAFKFAQKVNNTLTLTGVEVLMPQIFKTAGTEADGANPYFENRNYLIADINITEKLSLSIPVLFYQTRYRPYQAGAKNNDQWGYLIYIWPEVDYAINEAVTVGVAYVSDNLVKSDLSGFTLGDGLEKGLVQLVLTLSL